jgi:Raf kinase inhibitor-like YbhB/YbcL family protein
MPMTFTLRSSDFSEGGVIPRRYTCDGEDVSPALSWEGAPDDTLSLTLIVDDPDARGFAHWVLFDMAPAASSTVPAGVSASPDAPPQGTNDFGRIGYAGPCPPSGSHRYVFTLYALDSLLGLSGSPRPAEVRQAIRGHVLAEARLTASYRRG